MNQTRSYYWLLVAAIAACSNAAPANSSATNSGGAGATGGASAVGSTAASSGAQNNIGGNSEQVSLDSIGGSAAASRGGTSASEATAQATGGALGCGGTLTLGSVSPAQLSSELAQSHKFLLINVHVPLSGNIPGTDADITYQDIPGIEAFVGADKSQPAVLYCMSEGMSRPAGTSLVADGFCNIRLLTGGLSAWSSAGYPVDP